MGLCLLQLALYCSCITLFVLHLMCAFVSCLPVLRA